MGKSVINQQFLVGIDSSEANDPYGMAANLEAAIRLARVVDQLRTAAADRPVNAPVFVESHEVCSCAGHPFDTLASADDFACVGNDSLVDGNLL